MSRTMFALAVTVLAAATAGATLDPQADSFGVYFDTSGNQNILNPPLFTPFYAYLLVAAPSAPLDSFECRVTRSEPGCLVLDTALGEGAVDYDPDLDGFRVQRTTPYPIVGDTVVLVHWTLLQVATNIIEFYIGPAVPSSLPDAVPVLGYGGVLRPGRIASGSAEYPVACLYCMIDRVEATSFGAIKSLYR